MEQPLVTVVVVSYNHSKFVKENLDSIKNQTYSNIQLIVGDDASPDNSADVIDQWLTENNYSAEKNIHTKNTGLATMLNECVALAKGKYIKLIAADDFLHPEAIEKSVSKLESLGDSYGMVFTHTHTINNDSQIMEDMADYDALGNIDPYVFRKELIKGNRIAALTVLQRTDVLRETGAYDSRLTVEDYYRWLKINENYLTAYVPEKLAYYRLHPENISKVKEEKIQIETILLQMMFDKEGVARERINGQTQKFYLTGKTLSPEYRLVYSKYPFHIKRLSFALNKRLPVLLYKLLNKMI
ncbi:glycosyltransferase family 2 protein [Chryseobacterium herbae]|uniref:Glycosyltransferase family 2 protein n=1 Tax=Chryseobacterium herbae TaxID=2976476 RepID=A0ABT2IWZ5_9FLAO|nr:glycosyltransferase family A protein [Chryseobacterium sp. pc1-10]MCT2563135.1 glycosyltransferase family 2 protein [Chryseobacterium sp. pc1-10]